MITEIKGDILNHVRHLRSVSDGDLHWYYVISKMYGLCVCVFVYSITHEQILHTWLGLYNTMSPIHIIVMSSAIHVYITQKMSNVL